MIVAAFLFGVLIFCISVFFLISYINSNKSWRRNQHARVRQRELQLKLEADLRARIEADAHQFDEARRALLGREGGDSERPGRKHAV
ncbi:MAG TPA: hypothetical protein VEZ40_16305 [Pyrinomonadaceae bacterium]|nr:hypothetical protein [Pyrinomonadaceae bacterium]